MVKRFKSTAILVIFLANLLLAVQNGFNVLNIVALLLSGIVMVLEVFVGGNRHE